MKKITFTLILALALVAGYRLMFPAAHIRNLPPSGETIICFGDSLTSGYGASEGMDYPARLSRMLGRPVINAGVAGDTTGSALERVQSDVLSHSPRIVLITLGGNDLKNRVPRAEAFENLKQIVEVIQDRGALVIIGGIDLPLFGRGYGRAYQTLAEETGAILIPDILGGIFGKRELMSDPIHPNDAGYERMARHFLEAIPPQAL